MNDRTFTSFLHFAILLAVAMPAYTQTQHRNQLPDGFVALFSGRDFKGWDGGEAKGPAYFEKLSYQQWYDYRNRMNAGLHKHWRIKDGQLIGTGQGPDLVTWKHYGDFEMWIDWKLTAQSAAGIGLRYGSQIRLIDPAQADDATAGSGALATNKTHRPTTSQRADKAIGQWNRMYIRIVGPYVKVVLNDIAVVDNVELENRFDRQRPIDMKGPIHLQSLSGEVAYRNVSIRELSSERSNELLDEIAGDDEKYESLFNGKDLSGWAGAEKGYEVVEGELRCRRQDFGNLQTLKQYTDFIVRMEFKLPPGSNNGLLIRTPNTNPTHTRDTLEIQILDDDHIMHRHLGPSQYHGSAYGFTPAIRGYLRPSGQWNHQEVCVNGDHIMVRLNGYKILDTQLKKVAPDHPAANTKRGHFGLSGYSDPVAFKNLRIKEID